MLSFVALCRTSSKQSQATCVRRPVRIQQVSLPLPLYVEVSAAVQQTISYYLCAAVAGHNMTMVVPAQRHCIQARTWHSHDLLACLSQSYWKRCAFLHRSRLILHLPIKNMPTEHTRALRTSIAHSRVSAIKERLTVMRRGEGSQD